LCHELEEQSQKASASPMRELSGSDLREISGGDKEPTCSYNKSGTLVCKGAVITATKK
jgi:hypothetical protein